MLKEYQDMQFYVYSLSKSLNIHKGKVTVFKMGYWLTPYHGNSEGYALLLTQAYEEPLYEIDTKVSCRRCITFGITGLSSLFHRTLKDIAVQKLDLFPSSSHVQ